MCIPNFVQISVTKYIYVDLIYLELSIKDWLPLKSKEIQWTLNLLG
jgi:hypothetical protein